MVLFIISLLLGGLLVPLATQLEGRQRKEAELQLEEIVEALIGFAIINGRLPCYSSETDPNHANYGLEDSPCSPTARTADGYLPWKTLGVPAVDPWGTPRTNVGDLWTGHWRYRVDNNFHTTPFTLSTNSSTGSGLRVEELDLSTSSAGSPQFKRLTAATETPVAIIYSTGANSVQDGKNADYEQTLVDDPTYEAGTPNNLDRDGNGDLDNEFDDITVWLSRPLLFNKMVTAGKLP
jgi:type II secretory pathway pseudopilin PulG